MEQIQLGATGLRVSRICFGTMTFGGQAGPAESREMIDACFAAGVNFFDTANVYNAGASEKILGEILAGRRHKAILASKVRGKMGDGPDQVGLSRKAIFRAIDESLSRLQTDYLDLYYLHLPDYSVPVEESLGAMDDLVKAGKIRFPAVSNYASWQVTKMRWLAERKGWLPVTVSQPMYNLIARGIEDEYLPMCRELDIATIVYNPLAGGLLTGKQSPRAPLTGSRFDNNKMYLDRYWHDADFTAVEQLREIAASAARSLTSLALNWVLHHTSATGVILGASQLTQLQENLHALDDGPLPAPAVAACDEVWKQLRGVTPKYNR
jgi:aryl-alcohol dehydrogenase-like predicted oxidoreductase